MDGAPHFFRGNEHYAEVIADERLSRPGRAIRVYNYARFSGDEKLYVIGTEHKLFDAQTQNQVKPEEVLSRESAPDGWSVEGFALDLLPDTEIKIILGL